MKISPDTVIALSKNLIYFNNGGSTSHLVNKVSSQYPEKGIESYYTCKMSLVKEGTGLGFKPSGDAFDSIYINYRDDKTSLAKAGDVKVIASGGFSGCIFQLWRDSSGGIWGAHVYKGKNSTADISGKAKLNKWKLLYSLDTAGKGKAGSEIFVVAIIGVNNIDIVSQRIRNGKSEKLVDWHTVNNYNKA